MKKVVEMDYSYLVEVDVPESTMAKEIKAAVAVSSTAVLLNLLKKDVELYNNLLADAEKNQDLRLVPQLEAEIAEMKDMIASIEKDDLHRHLRLISNEDF